MKTSAASDHVYLNDGFKCSSISITNIDQNSSPQGSTMSPDGKKVIPPDERWDYIKTWFRDQNHKIFNRKTLYKRLPITQWLPKYSSEDAVGDIVAGLTVGLTVIPQALAYAGIAGLPAAYGLYGAFLGSFVYIFLGSCKDVPMGPSAITALLTFQIAQGSWQMATFLCFVTGVVELLMGLFGLGFLIDFVSGPVSSGFTSAVSLIIVTSQVKDILGIAAKGNTFLEIWTQIIKNAENTQLGDCILGVICIAVLLILKILQSFKIGPEIDELRSKRQIYCNRVLWFIGTSRNAILVIVCGLIAYVFQNSAYGIPFKVIGHIPAGLPDIKPPPFFIQANETIIGEDLNFFGAVSKIGWGLIILPLISLMEDVSICKAFGNGKPVDATQELVAIGVANIANSFVSGFPGTGALSRGAVNNASGVRTPFSSIYAGVLVLLALLFFTPYFYFIPKACLAAIIIAAVVFMVEVKVVKPMWRTKKSDLIPGIATFMACLILPLEVGLLLGVGLHIISILYYAARPKVDIETLTTRGGIEYLMLTPDRCLMFPSVDYVRNLVTKFSMRQNAPVVVDCSHIYGTDYTAATVIRSITKDFSSRSQLLLFFNLKPSVYAIFEGLSPEDFHVFYHEDQLDGLLKELNYIPMSPTV